MTTAIVQINAARDAINATAEALLAHKGVTEVYSVAGQWDLVAIIRVKDAEQLAELITNQLLKIPTIQKTQTLIAFRTFSKYDMDVMFDMGLD
ncbi:MAG: Lrp/AsnC ligand binding domain-containing protein [Phycisphaerales bacterium]|nr:Lrp/AsnC ligand binding domain-containing protein [Phycisphaerales bacterium]